MDGGFGKIFVYSEAPAEAVAGGAEAVVVFIDGSPSRAHRFVRAPLASLGAVLESLWAYLPEDYELATFLTNVESLVGSQLPLGKPFLKTVTGNDFDLARAVWAQPSEARVLTGIGWVERHEPAADELAARLREKRRRKKLLLHVCCGPDAAGVIAQLKRDFELTCFWYDPNIQPREEHDLRLAAFEQVARLEGVEYSVGEYDVDRFYDAIKGLEQTPEQGAKCSNCYDLRLERAAVEARRLGCELYTTTLAISPHKVQAKLRAFGKLSERRLGIKYLARNFMKHDGFRDSVAYTREHDIYRQDYCGCYFSMPEGGEAARWLAEQVPAATDPAALRPESLAPDQYRAYRERARAAQARGEKGPHKG